MAFHFIIYTCQSVIAFRTSDFLFGKFMAVIQISIVFFTSIPLIPLIIHQKPIQEFIVELEQKVNSS